MICPPCREEAHDLCAEVARLKANPDLHPFQVLGGKHCDCLHKPRAEGALAGSVRVLTDVKIVSYGPSPAASAFPGAGIRGTCNGGPDLSRAMVVPMTHWWFDHDRWVGAL